MRIFSQFLLTPTPDSANLFAVGTAEGLAMKNKAKQRRFGAPSRVAPLPRDSDSKLRTVTCFQALPRYPTTNSETPLTEARTGGPLPKPFGGRWPGGQCGAAVPRPVQPPTASWPSASHQGTPRTTEGWRPQAILLLCICRPTSCFRHSGVVAALRHPPTFRALTCRQNSHQHDFKSVGAFGQQAGQGALPSVEGRLAEIPALRDHL